MVNLFVQVAGEGFCMLKLGIEDVIISSTKRKVVQEVHRIALEDALKLPVDIVTGDSSDKNFLEMISDEEV